MKQLLTVLFLLTSIISISQQKVGNENFDKMLSSLLSHSVNEVVPADCHNKSIIFLDAREKEEYNISHIKNAIWTGYNTFKIKNIQNIPKNTQIVVYCTVGCRSEKVAEKLEKAGFINVSNLYGGIFEWAHTGHTVYNDIGVTNNIHTYNNEWGQWLTTGNKTN